MLITKGSALAAVEEEILDAKNQYELYAKMLLIYSIINNFDAC